GGTADRNRSHWSTSKTPSYTKSVSWQHHRPDTYRISDDLFTKKAMNWRKTICPEGLSVPLLLPDCNNRYYSKYCLFHLRSCF
ncbi:hypothetical protein EFK02_21860, partial [Escherichia coli]|nr:hypothetical protein [Escherichia coli]